MAVMMRAGTEFIGYIASARPFSGPWDWEEFNSDGVWLLHHPAVQTTIGRSSNCRVILLSLAEEIAPQEDADRIAENLAAGRLPSTEDLTTSALVICKDGDGMVFITPGALNPFPIHMHPEQLATAASHPDLYGLCGPIGSTVLGQMIAVTQAEEVQYASWDSGAVYEA